MNACANNRWGTRTRAVTAVSLFATLFLISAFAAGPEKQVQVDAAHLREALAENMPHVHAAEVKLNDGSVLRTKRMNADTDALRVKPNDATVGERVIPYTDIASIRLDLGARRGWQIAGGVLGGYIGGAIAGFAAQESSDTAERVAVFTGLGAGAVLGTKLGGHHRKILVIDVK